MLVLFYFDNIYLSLFIKVFVHVVLDKYAISMPIKSCYVYFLYRN